MEHRGGDLLYIDVDRFYGMPIAPHFSRSRRFPDGLECIIGAGEILGVSPTTCIAICVPHYEIIPNYPVKQTATQALQNHNSWGKEAPPRHKLPPLSLHNSRSIHRTSIASFKSRILFLRASHLLDTPRDSPASSSIFMLSRLNAHCSENSRSGFVGPDIRT